MSDKDFKVKNKLVLNGLTQTGPLVADSNKQVDATPYLTTLQGGTGTTTSPSSGQVLFSSGGTTYTPTTLNTLDVKGASYSADAPSSPFVGQVWVDSTSAVSSFDSNIIRRKSFTATAGQTVFTTDFVFVNGYEQVYFNGMLLLRNSDYTTNGAAYTVTLTSAAAANDVVEVVTITNLNSINTATTTTNTFTGNQTINNNTGTILSVIGDASIAEPVNIFRSNEASGVVSRRNNGSYSNPTSVLSGERTAFYIGGSYDGASYVNHAAINMWASENQTSTARGSYISFDTTSIGSAGRAERLRIDSNGNTSSLFNQSFANSSYAGKNVIINGAMDIWQRGTSFPSGVGLGSTVVYSADRWHWYRGLNDSGGTLTRQSAGLAGFQYCIRMQRNSGNTSTQALGLRYTAETADSVRFAGKQVTLSFWARKGANYSGSGNAFAAHIATGTGVDQVVHSFTGFTYISTQSITLTDTWQRFTLTGTAASNITQIGLEMFHTPTGTAGANDYMEITGIQLEEGSIATPFSRYAGGIQQELAACQRYYEQSEIYGLIGHAYSSTQFAFNYKFNVAKRAVPSVSMLSAGSYNLYSGNSTPRTMSSVGSNLVGLNQVQFLATVSNATTAGYSCHIDGGVSNAIVMSAEL